MNSKLTRNQNSNASLKTSSDLLLIYMDKMENSFLSPLHLSKNIYVKRYFSVCLCILIMGHTKNMNANQPFTIFFPAVTITLFPSKYFTIFGSQEWLRRARVGYTAVAVNIRK